MFSSKLAILEFFARSYDCVDVCYAHEQRINRDVEYLSISIVHYEGEGGYNSQSEYRLYPKSDAEIVTAGNLCRDIMGELDKINVKEQLVKYSFVQRDEDFSLILNPWIHEGNGCYSMFPERASIGKDLVEVLKAFRTYVFSIQ